MSDIHLESVVELLPEFEQSYIAPAGSRALVLDKKEEDGFDLIFVEWQADDEESYHGEDDGWAYSTHFKVVPRPTKLITRFPDEVEEMNEDDELSEEEYVETLMLAMDAAADSDAFLVLGIKPTEVEGKTTLKPVLFTMSRTSESLLMLEANLIGLVSDIFYQSAQAALKRTRDPEEEEDGR